MNLDQIRQKLQSLNKQTTKKRDIWKPKDKHDIRLVPYKHGSEPIIELGFHYDIGDANSVLCPKHNFGKDCVICDFAEALRSWNDENGKEKPEDVRRSDFDIYRKIQVKQRWYAVVVERGKESEGPKFWAFGKTIYERLLNMCLNEELNEVAGTNGTDVLFGTDSAFDLTVDFKQKNNGDGKGNTKNFPVTEVGHKLRPSPLSDSKKKIEEIIDQVQPITSVYEEVSSSEVEKIFNNFANSLGEPDTKSVGTEYKSNSSEKLVEGGRSIDEAFAELTGD